MNTTIERRQARHPKADINCPECRGGGYTLRYLDPLDPVPSTGVCRCVLKRIEGEQRGTGRRGRAR